MCCCRSEKLGTHYIRCDSLSALGKQFTVLKKLIDNYSDDLRLPLASDPAWWYCLWDLTYRWRSTDGMYSMLSSVDGICTRIHTCIGSALEHQHPGSPNTFKHAGI